MLSERDELIVRKDATDREKMRIEAEVHDERARKTDLQADNAQLTAARRQVENDLQITKASSPGKLEDMGECVHWHLLQTELDKTLNELKMAEESAKKVTADVARLGEELRNEQHHHDHLERQKRGLESALKAFWTAGMPLTKSRI